MCPAPGTWASRHCQAWGAASGKLTKAPLRWTKHPGLVLRFLCHLALNSLKSGVLSCLSRAKADFLREGKSTVLHHRGQAASSPDTPSPCSPQLTLILPSYPCPKCFPCSGIFREMASRDGGYGVSCLSGDNLILSITDSQYGPPGHGGGHPTVSGLSRPFSLQGMWTLKILLQEITDHKG